MGGVVSGASKTFFSPLPRGVVFASEHRNVVNDVNIYAGLTIIENMIMIVTIGLPRKPSDKQRKIMFSLKFKRGEAFADRSHTPCPSVWQVEPPLQLCHLGCLESPVLRC